MPPKGGRMEVSMTQNRTEIKLPHLISDGMVLQRNAQVKLWGWAPAGEIITVHFIEKVWRTIVQAMANSP